MKDEESIDVKSFMKKNFVDFGRTIFRWFSYGITVVILVVRYYNPIDKTIMSEISMICTYAVIMHPLLPLMGFLLGTTEDSKKPEDDL